MTTRLYLVLDSTERNALSKLAEMELRSPRNQIRAILRSELERHGLLSPLTSQSISDETKEMMKGISDE